MSIKQCDKYLRLRLFMIALMAIMSLSIYAQGFTVFGVVTDDVGVTTIGATVRVQGSAAGAVTGLDGKISKVKKNA